MPPAFTPVLSTDEVRVAFPELHIHGYLGQGGQGAVFGCRDTDGTETVLKVYGPATETLRVDWEIEKLSTLRSPYVVRFIRRGVVQLRGGDLIFCLVERVDGQDLANQNGTLDDAQTRKLIRDVAKGIEAMWGARVVHRDLKPPNVLRDAQGNYVIIDLGYAKHLDQDTITRLGYTCGTLGYMSPEQAGARPGLTFRSDLYALGILAYEMASGSHPFGRNQLKVGTSVPPPVPGLSPSTQQLLTKLLQPNPLDRPRSPREVYLTCEALER